MLICKNHSQNSDIICRFRPQIQNKMKKSIFGKILGFAAVILLVTTACNHKWTEQERKDFETKCAKTDSVRDLVVNFKGFVNSDFDSVAVYELNGTALADSFKLYVSLSDEVGGAYRSAHIERPLCLKHRYQFVIPGQKPYELSDMKMIMWAQYTMSAEGWGCVMGDYIIDGKHFEHDANPTFQKRDTSTTK